MTQLHEALAAHRSGRLTEALPLYERALAESPEDPDTLHFLGLLRHDLGQNGPAIELIKRSLQLAPGNPHAWINLGNILVELGLHPHAKRAYQEACTVGADLPDAWYGLGMCLRNIDEPQNAVGPLTRSLELRPDNARCLHERAMAHRDARELDAAERDYRAAAALDPADARVREGFGRLLYRLNRVEEAARVYREWRELEPDNPVAVYLSSAMSGDTALTRAPDEYITKSFDNFASTYEDNLTSLGYQAHELVTAALRAAADGRVLAHVLDAGCGTGFCGPLLRPIARCLTGVDLSASMIDRARAKGSYDLFEVAELCGFMRAHSATFDAVVSADTLNYFGALEDPFAAAAACLRPGGSLVFTLEKTAEDATQTYRVEPHGRYSHDPEYVRAALAAAGFAQVQAVDGTLRRERGVDVAGLVFTARAKDG
jgi:predicted TPR repeat methyltransferase